MGLKDSASQNSAASQQAASTPSGCKACERKGVPLFPVRVAAVPKSTVAPSWQPAVPPQDVALTGGEFKYALRTLRMGYLYVLLDKTVWEGYEVTQEGFLRYFNPSDMPESGSVEPLSEACRIADHDVKASFIHIDNSKKDREVWMAFSSDPWSETVLKEYKSGVRPDSRFAKLMVTRQGDVKGDNKNAPRVLDSSLLALTSDVTEFATAFFPNVIPEDKNIRGGAHGFFHRLSRAKINAMSSCVGQLEDTYKCKVMAIVLDDSVGIVQELNYARLDAVDALARYRSRPEILHKSTISNAIRHIREVVAKQIDADKEIKTETIFYPLGEGHFETVIYSREEKVKDTTRSAMERMEKYYNETERSTFASGYQATVDFYERFMQAAAKDLEAWYGSASWNSVIRHDYSAESSTISWAAQLRTLATSLQGGMVGMNVEKTIWKTWLQDPSSPPFLALLGKEPSLIATIFSGGATYANIKSFLTSQGVTDFVDSVQFSAPVSTLVTSMSGAFSLVGKSLSDTAEKGFVRTLEALASVAEGEPAVTIFSGKITVREFQDIMLRQMDNYGRPVWNTVREGKNITQTTARMATWMQVTDPVILEQKIEVRFTSLLKDIEAPEFRPLARRAGTSPGALKNGTLLKDGRHLSSFPNLILAGNAVESSLSAGEMSMSLGDSLRITRQQYQLPRRVFSSSGLGLVLAAVMLGLQKKTMDDNLKALNATVGGDAQAEMKLASSVLMVTSATIETIGFGHMVVRWGTAPWDLKHNVFVGGKGIYVHPLLRVAGVIGGIASLVDGVVLWIKSKDAGQSGESNAASYYFLSAIMTGLSGFMGIVAGIIGNFSFLGPIGLCIGLAVLGTILAMKAEQEIRSSLEIWLNDTCFGIEKYRGQYDKVWKAESLEDLQEALKAYYTIASGVSLKVQRERIAEVMLGSVGTSLLAVQVDLPDCSQAGSDWLVELVAMSQNGNKKLLWRSASPAKLNNFTAPEKQSYDINTPMGDGMWLSSTMSVESRLSESWEKSGLRLEGEFALSQARYSHAVLKVEYWPDKTKSENRLSLTANT